MNYSEQAFERLYKDSYRLMYRLAYSMVEDAEDARDVVSHVFTLVWQHKPKVDEGAMTSYLLRATHNQCLHLLRRREQQLMAQEVLRHDQPHTDDAGHKALLNELKRAISQHLSPQDRRVLELHYECDMTYEQTASTLGISSSAVNKHITQSLAKLRKLLKKK